MIGYFDFDWCGDKSDKKNTLSYIFKFLEAPISWCSMKQPVVALSKCEANYIVGSFAACQSYVAWFSVEGIEDLSEEANTVVSG